MKQQKHIVILGGGPAGLAAAYRLSSKDVRITVLEKEKRLGGLSGAIEINGNPYEFGTHVFHTDDEQVRNEITGLMGADMFSFERQSNIDIKFNGRYFRYPLSGMDVFMKLPLRLSSTAFLSLLYNEIKSKLSSHKASTAEQALIARFGKVLYEVFFKDYSRKVWGIPCSEMSSTFVDQRISRTDLVRVIKNISTRLGIIRSAKSHPLSEHALGLLYYTPTGSQKIFQKIGHLIVQNGGEILEGVEISKIKAVGPGPYEITFIREAKQEHIVCDAIISTIPIGSLVNTLDPPPDENILEAAKKLRYRALVAAGLLIKKPQIRPAFFTYFQDKTFNRLSEPTNHGLKTTPPGCSILLAEITCDEGDAIWNGGDDLIDRVKKEIVEEGLCKEEEILEAHIIRAPQAYPLYALGFEKHLETTKEYLDGFPDLLSTGRQGMFSYVNMHVAIKMGFEAAEEIIQRVAAETS